MFLTGKLDNTGELTEKEIIRAERNSGVISNRVREIQVCVMMLQLQTSTLKICTLFSMRYFTVIERHQCCTSIGDTTNVLPLTFNNFRCKMSYGKGNRKSAEKGT